MHISAGLSNSAYQFGARDGQLKKRSSSKQMISILEKKTTENKSHQLQQEIKKRDITLCWYIHALSSAFKQKATELA
jgi:hypothetical protein